MVTFKTGNLILFLTISTTWCTQSVHAPGSTQKKNNQLSKKNSYFLRILNEFLNRIDVDLSEDNKKENEDRDNAKEISRNLYHSVINTGNSEETQLFDSFSIKNNDCERLLNYSQTNSEKNKSSGTNQFSNQDQKETVKKKKQAGYSSSFSDIVPGIEPKYKNISSAINSKPSIQSANKKMCNPYLTYAPKEKTQKSDLDLRFLEAICANCKNKFLKKLDDYNIKSGNALYSIIYDDPLLNPYLTKTINLITTGNVFYYSAKFENLAKHYKEGIILIIENFEISIIENLQLNFNSFLFKLYLKAEIIKKLMINDKINNMILETCDIIRDASDFYRLKDPDSQLCFFKLIVCSIIVNESYEVYSIFDLIDIFKFLLEIDEAYEKIRFFMNDVLYNLVDNKEKLRIYINISCLVSFVLPSFWKDFAMICLEQKIDKSISYSNQLEMLDPKIIIFFEIAEEYVPTFLESLIIQNIHNESLELKIFDNMKKIVKNIFKTLPLRKFFTITLIEYSDLILLYPIRLLDMFYSSEFDPANKLFELFQNSDLVVKCNQPQFLTNFILKMIDDLFSDPNLYTDELITIYLSPFLINIESQIKSAVTDIFPSNTNNEIEYNSFEQMLYFSQYFIFFDSLDSNHLINIQLLFINIIKNSKITNGSKEILLLLVYYKFYDLFKKKGFLGKNVYNILLKYGFEGTILFNLFINKYKSGSPTDQKLEETDAELASQFILYFVDLIIHQSFIFDDTLNILVHLLFWTIQKKLKFQSKLVKKCIEMLLSYTKDKKITGLRIIEGMLAFIKYDYRCYKNNEDILAILEHLKSFYSEYDSEKEIFQELFARAKQLNIASVRRIRIKRKAERRQKISLNNIKEIACENQKKFYDARNKILKQRKEEGNMTKLSTEEIYDIYNLIKKANQGKMDEIPEESEISV